jgi:pyridoxal phosphate enzyme (YggS family)
MLIVPKKVLSLAIKENFQSINQRIARAAHQSGRQASDITLVAVSKTVSIDKINQAHKLGINDFGENRVKELLQKADQIPAVNWHMIGRLQTNKVKEIIGKVKMIHSLDRWNLIEEIEKRGQSAGVKVPALLEINISQEEQKAGFSSGEVKEVLEAAAYFKSLEIRGFMTMAPLSDDPETSRPVFRELAELKRKFEKNQYNNVRLDYLSMGMSGDFEVAIQEGANIVRIGTALFKDTEQG